LNFSKKRKNDEEIPSNQKKKRRTSEELEKLKTYICQCGKSYTSKGALKKHQIGKH
jgi:hypothetical protein